MRWCTTLTNIRPTLRAISGTTEKPRIVSHCLTVKINIVYWVNKYHQRQRQHHLINCLCCLSLLTQRHICLQTLHAMLVWLYGIVGFCRLLSVSFLIRTSGKEYHSQAGSTSTPAFLRQYCPGCMFCIQIKNSSISAELEKVYMK